MEADTGIPKRLTFTNNEQMWWRWVLSQMFVVGDIDYLETIPKPDSRIRRIQQSLIRRADKDEALWAMFVRNLLIERTHGNLPESVPFLVANRKMLAKIFSYWYPKKGQRIFGLPSLITVFGNYVLYVVGEREYLLLETRPVHKIDFAHNAEGEAVTVFEAEYFVPGDNSCDIVATMSELCDKATPYKSPSRVVEILSTRTPIAKRSNADTFISLR